MIDPSYKFLKKYIFLVEQEDHKIKMPISFTFLAAFSFKSRGAYAHEAFIFQKRRLASCVGYTGKTTARILKKVESPVKS